MNKTKTLIFLALLHAYVAFAQRDPSNEILVFFKEGVTREVETINGKTVFQPSITSERLKAELLKLGIDQSALEVANPKFKEADTLKVLSDGRTVIQLNMTKLFRFRVPEGKSKVELIDQLNKLPEVLYAEANGTVKPYLIPSDTRFNDQWGLVNTVTPGADIHADPAWDIFTGNPNNIIGIIDGGTDINHVDLNDKIAGGDTGFGWDGHGIHVSGIAAAESNNAQGISGVDWNARIHAQRIDNAQDDVDTYNAIVDAVNFSTNVHVLNNSWGTNPEGRYSITLRQAFAIAYKANRTSVVSMGNHQVTQPGVVGYPAGFDNVIAVGATNIFDNIANFSAQGNHIDVSAPGVDILSTFNGGGYGNQSGTSMAAAHVSGIASLLKGFNNNLANDDIENLVRLSADDLNNPGAGDGTGPGFDVSSGAGRVNAERALNFLRAPSTLNQWNTTGGTIVSSTNSYTMQFYGVQGLSDGNYTVVRHTVQKNVTFPTSMCQLTGAWGRGVNTTGWSLGNPNFGEGFCEVVPGTPTHTGATLRTYIYRVYTVLGQDLGFYPTTAANVNFAYSVLGIPNPTGASITGPTLVCTSGTFTMNNMPANYVYAWSTSSNLSIQSVSGNSVTVNKVSSGSGWVRATITSGFGISCSSPQSTITFNLHVGGYSSSDYPVSGPSSVCTNQYAYYSTNDLLHATNYAWFWPSDWEYSAGQGTRFLDLRTTSFSTSGVIGVRVANACDAGGSPGTKYTSVSSCGGFSIATYPNPATNELIIESEMVSSETETQSLLKDNDKNSVKEFSVKLRDSNGQIRKSGSTQSGKIVLGVSNFPDGVYYLEIITRETVFLKQVLLKR